MHSVSLCSHRLIKVAEKAIIRIAVRERRVCAPPGLHVEDRELSGRVEQAKRDI